MTAAVAPTQLLPDALYHRQQGLYNPAERPNDKATFIGCGGIGSFAAFAAGKLGVPNITLIDFDTVEVHNAPNQMHPIEDEGGTVIGVPKVDVTAAQIHEHSGGLVNVCPVNGKHSDADDISGVVVTGLDSMAARKAVWEDSIQYNPGVELLIDARISGQLILIYALPSPYVPGKLQDEYMATLHSDDEAEAVSCTEKGIIDVGFQCGALIARMLRRYFNGEPINNCTYMSQKSLMVRQWDWSE